MVTRRLKPLANAAWATNVLVVRTPEHRGTGRRIRLGRFPAQFLLARCRRRHECADGILGQLDGGHKRVSQMTRNGRSGVSHAYRSEDRFFRRWSICSAPAPLTFKSFQRRITNATLPNIKGRLISMRNCLADLIRCTKALEAAIAKLAPPAAK